jgi:hypothetical protein
MADDNAKDLDAKAKEVASGLSDLSKILKQKANAFSRLSGTTEGVDDLFTQLGDKLKVELETRQGAANNLRDQRILNSRLNERLGQYSGTLLGVIATSSAKIKEAKAQKELAKKEQELTESAIEKLKEKIKSDEELLEVDRRVKEIQDSQVASLEEIIAEQKKSLGSVVDNLDKEKEDLVSAIYKLQDKLTDPSRELTESHRRLSEDLLKQYEKKLGEIVEYEKNTSELEKLKESAKELADELEASTKEQEENSKQMEVLTKRIKDEADIIRTKGAAVWNARFAAMTNLAKEINKLVDPVRKLQQQFGITAGAAASLRFGALDQSIRSFANFLSGAPVSFKEIEAAVSDLRAEFGGIVSTREAREFAVAAKEMGVTTQQLAAARRVFMTQTMGDLAGAQSQQERFIKVFTQQGMTSRDAMEFIGSNSELLARSGARFQQSMAKAAGEAKKIGVDLSKVNQVGDNIIGNFEGFLESMAELGAMGFGFDATRLAEVAERGDTGALFDELRSQLRMTGRDLTDLTRSQQLALSNAFGMNIEDFQRMAGVTPDIGEEEKTNNFLKGLVDTSERIAGIMAGISTILGTFHLAYLKVIALNTRGAAGSGGPLGAIRDWFKGKKPGAPATSGGVTAGGTGIPTSIPGTGGSTPSKMPEGPGAPGVLNKLLQIKPSQLLAAGAAMIMIAGATFILAKAMQQFSDEVGWEGVIFGIASLAALTFAMIKMGAAMTLGAKPILIGAAAMTVMAGSLWVLGKAIQAIGVGFGMIGTGIATAISSIASVTEPLDALISRVGGIGLLILALGGLALSLAAVGAAGSLALPTLLALGAIIGGVGLIAGLAGRMRGGSGDASSSSTQVTSQPRTRTQGGYGPPVAQSIASSAGHGNRTLVTPDKTVSLNNDDTVVAMAPDSIMDGHDVISTNAGTELLSKGIIAKSAGESESNINVNVDLEKLERKLDQVISAMGSMQVIMDGNKVGRVMSDNEQKASTMGVFQTQRLTG